jgi:hypothetical protein
MLNRRAGEENRTLVSSLKNSHQSTADAFFFRRQPKRLRIGIRVTQYFGSCSAQFDGGAFIHFFIHRRGNLRSFKDT